VVPTESLIHHFVFLVTRFHLHGINTTEISSSKVLPIHKDDVK
jgi:hypothetical protein